MANRYVLLYFLIYVSHSVLTMFVVNSILWYLHVYYWVIIYDNKTFDYKYTL